MNLLNPDDSYPAVQAPLITFVSASGGVGKSTIALVMAALTARSGIDTALVEGDLQFGDYRLWLGLDSELPGMGDSADTTGVCIEDRLTLCLSPRLPEQSFELEEKAAESVKQARRSHELVICDTSSYWTGFTAELVTSSDIVCLVMDYRPASISSAVRANSLLNRLGVPDIRRVFIYNRWAPRTSVTVNRVQETLNVPEVYVINEGKAVVNELMSCGAYGELLESENSFIHGVNKVLVDVLPRVGHLYVPEPRGRRKRRAW